jgi:hypothetical protein
VRLIQLTIDWPDGAFGIDTPEDARASGLQLDALAKACE